MLILVIFNLIIYIYFNCCVLLDVHIQSSDCKYKLTYLYYLLTIALYLYISGTAKQTI